MNRMAPLTARVFLTTLGLALSVGAMMPEHAAAGGFFFTGRGTRPAGRGFAFVAGADDPQALHYNPAGLAYSGQQFLLDLSLTWFRGSYARVDSGGNTLPTVDLHTIPLPIPGIAYSHPLNDEFTLGVGLMVPNALLGDYPNGARADGSACDPESPDNTDCGPAPQRYSAYTLSGTALVQLEMALAWRPHPRISVGAGLGILLGNFAAEVALSACDNAICAQPEDPDYDARVQMTLERFWDLVPNLGVIVDLDMVRLGASFRFYPRGIQGTANLRVRLPAATFFEGAEVDGDNAEVDIPLPMILRLGAEVRPIDTLRVEAALVWERWSKQQEIGISPTDITLTNVTAIGDYAVGDVGILRDMNNTVSLRLGGELSILDGRLDLRAGFSFETSGFDDRTLTAMTIDTRKTVLGVGGSLRVGDSLLLDVAYAHVFMQNRNVSNSEVAQANGIRPNITGADAVFIGNGRYRWSADIFAVGLRYQFGGGERDAASDDTNALGADSAPGPEEVAPDPDADADAAGGETETETETDGGPASSADTPSATPPAVDDGQRSSSQQPDWAASEEARNADAEAAAAAEAEAAAEEARQRRRRRARRRRARQRRAAQQQ